MRRWFRSALLRSALPRGLYGRAALIVLMPIILIQLLVSVAFVQRHIEGVTWQMTGGVVQELDLLRDLYREGGMDVAGTHAAGLGLVLDLTKTAPLVDRIARWDVQGRNIAHIFHLRRPDLRSVDLMSDPEHVQVWLDWDSGIMRVKVERARVSASNPYQLLFLMLFAGVFIGMVAMYFLRLQLSPIARLSRAAEAFGKGQIVPYRPMGAVEVRAAGAAFLEMRNRIERQREQRTLLLSGISHDLRTPLTRMKLGLEMLDVHEAADLKRDVLEMERMIDEFLAFARGGATEAPRQTDPAALLEDVVRRAARSGIEVFLLPGEEVRPVMMRPDAVSRALENLINNAARYGDRAEASLLVTPKTLRFVIEDDGPGIPADQREEAMRPFTRLDPSRDPNEGGGVGLGLAIVSDIARSHGGHLRLSDSERLGGLKAELIISR